MILNYPLKQQCSNEEIIDFLNIIYKNIKYNNECILPRVELVRFSVDDALKDGTDILSKHISATGVKVVLHKSKNTQDIEDDILCFQQLFIALFSLTLYFVDNKNKIEIFAEQGGDANGKYVKVCIIDDGHLGMNLRRDFVKGMKQNALLFECKYDIEKLIEQAKINDSVIKFEDLENGVKTSLIFYLNSETNNSEIDELNNILLFKKPN